MSSLESKMEKSVAYHAPEIEIYSKTLLSSSYPSLLTKKVLKDDIFMVNKKI